MTKAAVAFCMVLLLAGGLGSADQPFVVNHPSSPVSLKSSAATELEIVNLCDCGISRIRLGCVRQDGTIEHEFRPREMKLSSNEKQTRIAKDADLEKIALCVRLGSQLSVIEVLADDGGEWRLTTRTPVSGSSAILLTPWRTGEFLGLQETVVSLVFSRAYKAEALSADAAITFH